MSNNDDNAVLDVGLQQVADVYAKALLGASEGTGKTDAVAVELDSLVVDLLDKFPAFEQTLASELIASEEKDGILDRVLGGKASADLLVFLKVLSAHGRLGCLRAIRASFTRQVNELRGRVDVELRFAGSVDEDVKKEVVAEIRQRLAIEPVVRVVADPSLIGGLVVAVGDTVYDGSLATRLKNMRHEMIEKSVEMIQADRQRLLTPEV